MENMTKHVFILTDEWQDIKGKDVVLTALNVPHKRKNVNMKNFAGVPVDAVYFNTQKDLKAAEELLSSRNISTYESDVDPARRFLMENVPKP